MDSLAHSLVGLAAAKAGLEKLSPGATAVCILAANAPDIDFIAAISRDRWTVLHHHRGFSHSVAGIITIGVLLPAIFYFVALLITKARGRANTFRFSGLLLASLLTVATHPLLDWTNSYGVRPFLPWSGKWIYGDLVFVVDPVLWLVLGSAAFFAASKSRRQLVLWSVLASLVTLLVLYVSLASRSVGHPAVIVTVWIGTLLAIVVSYRRHAGPPSPSKSAAVGLLLIVAYWSVLALLHGRALTSAASVVSGLMTDKNEHVLNLAATPALADPFSWRCLAETERAVYRFDLKLIGDGVSNTVRYEKPNAVQAPLIQEANDD